LLDDKRDKTGTWYRRNRSYDPATGRFTQEDPIGLAGGLNLYGFADGDPVNFGDPFGLCPACIIGAIWAAYEAGSAVYDAYQAYKTVRDPNASTAQKSAMVAAATYSIFGPGGGGTVVIGKFDDAGRLIGDVRAGERTLAGPNLGSPRANWHRNSGSLREAMRAGKPIRDAHVDPRTGALLKDRKSNGSGSFLTMERQLLEDRGWKYDPRSQHWLPPQR
jgi:RHS repeat-associated protein